MKKSRFSEEQIVAAIKQVELRGPIPELCRKYGVSQQTFYRWRSKYGGLAPSELRRLLSSIGYVPPVEYEVLYYRCGKAPAITAGVT